MNKEKPPEVLKELAAIVSKMISREMATIVDGNPFASISEDIIEGYEALIAECCIEDDTLMKSYTVAVQDLLKIVYMSANCMPFQWSSKELLDAKVAQQVYKLATSLLPRVKWHSRFRDKNHRDKIRTALEPQ